MCKKLIPGHIDDFEEFKTGRGSNFRCGEKSKKTRFRRVIWRCDLIDEIS